MPKYYVKFGTEYFLTVIAKTPREACVKTLKRYLQRDASDGDNSTVNTLCVPEKFSVSEQGFDYKHADVDKEFPYEEINKILDNKGEADCV